MYIAVELNEDGSMNDWGHVTAEPKNAWECVEETFHASNTVIYKLTPVFKVKAKKTRLIPIKELKKTWESFNEPYNYEFTCKCPRCHQDTKTYVYGSANQYEYTQCPCGFKKELIV